MSPVALFLHPNHYLSKAGSVGVLVPNLEARLLGSDSVDVKPGEPGELWLRGPTVMKVDHNPLFPTTFRIRARLIACVVRVT